jgi:NDP-sugar pyrophosphorylase family protein
MEPGVLKHIPKRRFMIEDFFKKLSKKNQVTGFMHDGTVFDVGSHEGYARAIKEWKKPHSMAGN